MARPRTISDQNIITAAYELLMERGLDGLTFETLSERVGIVPAALVRRFERKQKLIAQVDNYALALTNSKVAEALEKTASPVEAIIAQFTTELAFATTLERFANGQEFLLMDLRSEELYNNYQASFEQRHQQVVELLQIAEAAGELTGINDAPRLARHLALIAHGAGHVWAMAQEMSIEEYIRQHVMLALQPYRLKVKK